MPAIGSSFARVWRLGLLAAGWAWGGLMAAPAPVVGIGATRDAVLDAYGWPSGQSQSGEKEIFTYPQGQVVLKGGVVERMEFAPNVAWPKPKPRPGAPTVVKEKAPPPVPVVEDFWLASFNEASREARARPAQILVLFTGSDWSPPCQRFQAEVATNPAFVKTIGAEFVLLRLDFPMHARQAAELRMQNATLRERFGVTTYPTLLLMSAEGLEISRVDLAKARPQATYAEQVIAAITEAKPKPAALLTWREREARRAAPDEPGRFPGWRQLNDFRWVIAGTLVVLFGCWLLLRRRPVPGTPPPEPTHKGILPTPADLATWTQERVRDVAAALFEFEGLRVQVRSTETGAELALFNPKETRPCALVRCQSSSAGLANGKSVRTLFATIVAERVDNAWYVSPGGFTPEARKFAREHGMVLIGGEDLLTRLKAVPPLAVIRMLSTPTA